jgi:hypothetical protein
MVHMRGHQEKVKTNLSTVEEMNCKADELAKQANSINRPWLNIPYSLPQEKWQIYIGSQKIHKDLEAQLRDYTCGSSMKAFLAKHNKVPFHAFDYVNWEAVDSAMKSSTLANRIWITKRVANDCGSNAILFQRKQRPNDECPFCKQSETVLHVYLCTHEEVQRKWDSEMDKLRIEMQIAQTSPIIIEQLILGLRKWRMGNVSDSHDLITQQNQIGWNAVLEGCLGRFWEGYQDVYIQQQSIQQSSQKWAARLVRRLWKIAWELWQHRNSKEHNDDMTKELARLEREIINEIEIGPQNISVLQKFFTTNEVNKVQGGNQGYKIAWLRNVKAGRKWALHHEGSREMISMRRHLQRFLQNNQS